MPIPLPRLDRHTYPELVAEGRGMIPLLAPGWTDHNASDPGITLLEHLAAVVETIGYRLDRVPEATVLAFLRLVGIVPHPARAAWTVLAVAGQPAVAGRVLPAGVPVRDATGTVIFRTAARIVPSPARLVGWEQAADPLLRLEFDGPLGPPGTPVSLYVASGAADLDAALVAALVAEWRAERAESDCPWRVPQWSTHHGARTVWEYAAGGGWLPLASVVDRTRALTLSGCVRFPAPDAAGPAVVRCRLASGGYELPPRPAAVLLNALPARHGADVPERRIGESTGAAGQRFHVAGGVLPGSTRLRTVPDRGPWTEVADLGRTGPHDRHYRLVPATDEIAFGDGRRGAVPPAGDAVHLRHRTGGGPGGNVAAGTLVDWVGQPPGTAGLTVTQPLPAVGGADAEPLADAQGRAVELLTSPDRAVTVADVEALARAVPGVPVAAARAVVDRHPALPCVPADGCITVVAVPAGPRDRPEATPAFLRAIARYLARRRTVTTELHVVGPTFTAVEVAARLWVPGGRRDVAAAAVAALRRWLHPLDGGPAGTGWPVGATVHRSEVQALLGGLPDVVGVDRLTLRALPHGAPLCGNLAICADSLVVSGDHRIDLVDGAAP